MLSRLSRDREARRTLGSVASNLLAKLPGICVTLLALPIARRGLGDASYARVLADIALAALLAMPLTGINYVVRRKIIEASAIHEKQAEANVAASSVTLAGIYFAVCCIAVSSINFLVGQTTDLQILIIAIPLFTSTLNVMDNVRFGYNSHYVTAFFQFFLQILALTLALVLGISRPVYFAALMTLPMGISSVCSTILLIHERPYLLSGRPTNLVRMARASLAPSLSDGAVSALLNGSVFLSVQILTAPAAAWYSTLVRIYNVALSPVMLVLLPASTYVAIKLQTVGPRVAQRTERYVAAGALAYGLINGCAVMLVGTLFAAHAVGIRYSASLAAEGAFAVFFAGVLAYRVYAQYAFTVRHSNALAQRSSLFAAIAFGTGACLTIFAPSPNAIYALACASGICLSAMIISESLSNHPSTAGYKSVAR